MKSVLIIGKKYIKSGIPADGGRLKVLLYEKKLKDEGNIVSILDLYHWFYHPFKLISLIKKGVKTNDVILIMGGPKGCRPIIKIVNHFNKKHHKRVGFCPLGIGTLDKLLRNKNSQQVQSFMKGEDFLGINDKKMKLELDKLDFIMPQNSIIFDVYKKFYQLNNLTLVNNFRDFKQKELKIHENKDDIIPLIFVSRVTENKGIFDVLEAVKKINSPMVKFTLDIYGEKQLNKEELSKFDNFLNETIRYHGPISNDKINELYNNYSLLVFPTKYYGEGTPGTIIEALISGLPILISNYSQATLLIKDNISGLIYDFNNINSLIDRLDYVYNNQKILKTFAENAYKEGSKYLYENNRKVFLETILGETINE